MTDQNIANLINLLTTQTLMTQASVDTLSNNVTNEMNSMKDLLHQILAKVSALENNDDNTMAHPIHEQSLARPTNPNDEIPVFKAALGTTLATEGFSIDTDQAYRFISNVAIGLANGLTAASYNSGTTKANWRDPRPEAKTALIAEITRKAKERHIHLDRCVNNWAAREI
ncbi:hypothetical protein, partial, partial [Absidia glauca]